MQTIKLHTNIESANASAQAGELIVSEKWKETANQQAKERAVCLPFECLKAPEVPESFRALVEAALLQSAKATLKAFVNDSPNSYEADANLFCRPQLVENFLAEQAGMKVSKDRLCEMLEQSATWQRIASRPEFVRKDAHYMRAVNQFKEALLGITARTCAHSEEKLDTLLAKLEESDLSTEFGVYVSRRIANLKKKPTTEEFDLSAL